jgi:hypothetical protein
MGLEDLKQYAKAQTTKINRLIENGSFAPGPVSNYWTEFKKSVWGKGLASFQATVPVERDEDRVEDPCIPPGSVPLTTSVTTIPDTFPTDWGPSSRLISARSEYDKAEETALLANETGRDVLMVTGQSGIGPFPSRSVACRT